jgi:8-oxo-dGTP pyrophosphatase MutT (NUDIX family)
MPYDPAKRYFYVEHPTEGWRVFLRACCFIHEKPAAGAATKAAIDPMKFVVVKRAYANPASTTWEPPKGQMEGKEGLRNPSDSILKILKENMKREVAEESRIRRMENLNYTGLVLEGVEKDYPPNTFFQYHIFRAVVTPAEFRHASEELLWYREHPDAFARLKRDKREKDDITWYSPSETQLMGKWSPRIVAMYLKAFA